MDSFGLDGLSLNRIEFIGEAGNFRIPLGFHNNRVVVVGETGPDLSIKNYLEAEGFRVIVAQPSEAFETIRWEQPALALLQGGLHGEACVKLVQRLKKEVLTRNIELVVCAVEPPQAHTSKLAQQVIFIKDAATLRQAVQQVRKRNRPDYLENMWVLDFGKEKRLQAWLSNSRLRHFVDEVVDSWPTLLVATLLGQDLEAVINIEQLYYRFELTWEESIEAINRLSQAGYIEPLEFDGSDPLYGVVAWEEQNETLVELGRAMLLPEYRKAVATLILARERAVK